VHRGIYEAVATADKALASERLSTHFDDIRTIIVRTTAWALLPGRSGPAAAGAQPGA